MCVCVCVNTNNSFEIIDAHNHSIVTEESSAAASRFR